MRPGRPQVTYADPFLRVAHKDHNRWHLFVINTEQAVRVARKIRRDELALAHTMVLDNGKSVLAVKSIQTTSM